MPEFLVEYRVMGRMTGLVTADSHAEAVAKIEEEVNRDDWEADLDEVDDVDFSVNELIPVIRDGKRIKTTYVRAGDERVVE